MANRRRGSCGRRVPAAATSQARVNGKDPDGRVPLDATYRAIMKASAGPQGLDAALGLCFSSRSALKIAIGAEQSIPPRQVEAEVTSSMTLAGAALGEACGMNRPSEPEPARVEDGLSNATSPAAHGLVLPCIRCWPGERGFSAKMDLALPRLEVQGPGLSPPGWCRVPTAWQGQGQHNGFATNTLNLMHVFLRVCYITNSLRMPLSD